MIVARRVYLYGIAFASIWMLVNGVAGLLEIVLTALFEAIIGPLQTIGESSLANEVSFAGALTGIGLIVWIIHWGLALRATSQDELPERRSAIRKLYLYGVLFIGGLVLVYQLRTLIIDLLGLLFGTVTGPDLITGDVTPPLAMVLTIGVLWAYHARIARQDAQIVPEAGAGATIRRWCVYLLSLTGLMMLIFGTIGLLTRLFDLAVPADAQVVESGRWFALEASGRISSILVGLLFWLAAWRWSTRQFDQPAGPSPERNSVLRKVYLYGVLFISVSWTVWNLGRVLYVALRSVLIPSQAGALWSTVQHDLGGTLAHVLIFGIAWAYHARVITREAAVATEAGRQSTIRWIYGYIVALVGSATLASGLFGLLATLLDLLAQSGASMYDEYWWQEALSLYGTLVVVGLPVWLIPWLRLQREVVASVARRSLARRIYLFLMLAATVLTLLAAGAYTLYQLLRVILGDRWSVSNTSDLLWAISAAIIAGLLLAYHLAVFRRDAALAAQDEAANPPPVTPATSTPLLADGTAPTDPSELVTLLVIRPTSPATADLLRAQVAASLPPGVTIQTVQVPPSDATRLLSPPLRAGDDVGDADSRAAQRAGG